MPRLFSKQHKNQSSSATNGSTPALHVTQTRKNRTKRHAQWARPAGQFLPALLLASAAYAQSPAILRTVDDHYNHLGSLRARFAERYTGMGMSRAESGTLLLKKPGRMAWHYDTPAGKIFVFDGKFAWFYTPGDPQAQRIPGKQMDDLRSPLRFLLGHTSLEKELDHISVAPDGDQFRITGVPRGMEQRVKQITLRVTPAGAITRMQLEEMDGATTEFAFTDLQENAPTANSDFTFTPPPGVTVITGSPPI